MLRSVGGQRQTVGVGQKKEAVRRGSITSMQLGHRDVSTCTGHSDLGMQVKSSMCVDRSQGEKPWEAYV
jgi:hypothetical protein